MSDALSFLDPNAPNSSPLVTTDQFGMPISDGTAPAPSNLLQTDPDQSSHPGFLTSLENLGSKAVSGVESAVKATYSGAKTVAGDAVGGAESVVSSVTGSITSNLVIILVVVGVALVLVARSGAIKISQ